MNRLVLRDLVLVPLAIAIITTTALALAGRPPQQEPVLPPPHVRTKDPVKLGAELYALKGCNVCHTIDGTPRIGPTFLHDYGAVAMLADGTTITVSDDYIRESIRYPQAQARPSYPPSMPTFDASLLNDREVDAIIAYLRSLR